MDSAPDPGTVYVVDDEAGIRRAIGALLTSNGLDHQSYETADQFLHHYVDRGPACIICDVRMPGITGLQLLERTVELNITHPVIFMTAYGDLDTAVHCFRHGAVDFFEKPVCGTVLLGSIHDAIERDRTARLLDHARRRTLDASGTLSPRERQVMDMLFDGMPNKAVAHELNLSEKTIAAHRAHILDKMAAGSLPELVRMLTLSRLKPSVAVAAA